MEWDGKLSTDETIVKKSKQLNSIKRSAVKLGVGDEWNGINTENLLQELLIIDTFDRQGFDFESMVPVATGWSLLIDEVE